MAEGVGFEPTVGCPTLDFESSALNRTQPPFPLSLKNHLTNAGCERALKFVGEADSFPDSCLAINEYAQFVGHGAPFAKANRHASIVRPMAITLRRLAPSDFETWARRTNWRAENF